jgi:hypothetical protein
MNTLLQRLQDASEGSRELDLELAKYAFEKRIPMDPFYAGAINYDYELWTDHYGWSPTDSIDAAMTLYEVLPDMVPSCPRKACIAAIRARDEL